MVTAEVHRNSAGISYHDGRIVADQQEPAGVTHLQPEPKWQDQSHVQLA